jgi:diacylglycerol kinase (ATP)
MDGPPERRSFWRSRAASFRHAWRGLRLLVRTQANARLHLAATVLVVIAGLVLRVSRGEWGLLALASGLVWAAEALNTAVELLADRVSMEHDARLGRVKDLAAAAVLLAAIAAVVVGAVVFVPRVLGRGGG